jgi:hypothetical protein
MQRIFYCVILLSISVISVVACSSAPAPPEGRVSFQDRVINIDGHISAATLEELVRLTEANPDVRHLRVTSKRGDPMAAMQIGYLLQQKQFVIEVSDVCLEACANYLFTAAEERIVHDNALVAWSGGALDHSWIYQWRSYILPGLKSFVTLYADTYLRRETRFFQRINVDQHITVYGFDKNIGCVDNSYRGFYYSAADLLSMGVGVTRFIPEHGTQDFQITNSNYCRVDLSNRLLLIN